MVIAFVVHSSSGQPADNGVFAAANATSSSTNPLDQLSSADIAVNIAQMVNLPETTAVINQADSVDTELTVPEAGETVVAETQVPETDIKSRADITTYTVQSGDTVTSIAARFNITADSVRWSNGLTGDAVNVGIKLVIPPINGIVYTVKPGDTPASLATKYNANASQITSFNDAELSGLPVGEQIVIPNGQPPAPVVEISSSYSASYGGPFAATYGDNGYDFGFCTWYVASRRIQIGDPVPTDLGNADTWAYRAAAFGMLVNNTPSYGAAVVLSEVHEGHVAFVEQVNPDGSVWVTEMNSRGQVSMTDTASAGGWDRVDWKLIPASSANDYSYIH
jgi:surface antigen